MIRRAAAPPNSREGIGGVRWRPGGERCLEAFRSALLPPHTGLATLWLRTASGGDEAGMRKILDPTLSGCERMMNIKPFRSLSSTAQTSARSFLGQAESGRCVGSPMAPENEEAFE